eukprot:EST47259.1 O-phosphoseryl-tRNA(Sec) selenium transferase [Spironucleus salmonicida]
MPYIELIKERENAYENVKNQLISSQQIPKYGYSQHIIQQLLFYFSSADFNNHQSSGAGEREGRVFSSLVQQRHYGFSHGIGRSGDLLEDQPKAAGSSLLHRITRNLACHALQKCGFQAKDTLITPFCVGMSINYIIQHLKLKTIAWIRMDQKSVPKAIQLSGAKIIVINTIAKNNYVIGDYNQLELIINDVDCVISTTSCFSPRVPDNMQQICQIVGKNKKYHIVNNAYGIHSEIMHQLNKYPSINFVVSSLDKNFMIPVSGCLIYSKYKQQIQDLGKSYAGRASGSQIIDLFITLLELGQMGIAQLQKQRRNIFELFVNELQKIPQIVVTTIPDNDISFYFYFTDQSKYEAKKISSELFRSGISGSKALIKGKTEFFQTFILEDFGRGGVHDFPDYITCAASIGMQQTEVYNYIKKLKQIISSVQ